MKYADLSNDRIKDYVFDWDRMLAFDGNTAPYLQYAHARIRSIFRRAAIDRPSRARSVPPSLGEPQERALALRLARLRRGRRRDGSRRYAPHKLCTYLLELAAAFTAFYEACPVLKAADEVTRDRAGWRSATSPPGSSPGPRPARDRGARSRCDTRLH